VSKPVISEEIKKQVDQIVRRFNENVIRKPDLYYTTRYKGSFLYLDRLFYGRVSNVCRLKYIGDMNDWEFAIYKYSNERYDPDEWMFPGSGHVDGTVEGAMKAGLEAYPQ